MMVTSRKWWEIQHDLVVEGLSWETPAIELRILAENGMLSAALRREQAIRLRDALNEWLGERETEAMTVPLARLRALWEEVERVAEASGEGFAVAGVLRDMVEATEMAAVDEP